MDQKPRILYITTIDITMWRFLLPHMQALRERGYEVEAAFRTGDFTYEIEKQGIRAHHIPFNRQVISFDNVRAFLRLYQLFKERHYDLIHVHTPIAAFLGRLVAKWVGRTKILYTAHGFHFIEGGVWYKNLLFLGLERLGSLWTDALIVMNSEDYATAKKYHLAPKQKIYFVKGVGLDTDFFSPGRLSTEQIRQIKQELGCCAELTVGMIAEFIPRKRQIDLLLAGAQLLERGLDVDFVFMGDGPMLAEMKNLPSIKDNNHFKFLGFRDDIYRLLDIMDIVVLVSLREGLPRSIQEAMAMAKPVVVTDVKGNRDLVTNGETGFIVPPKDPESLADTLLRLLTEQDLRQRLGKAARKFVLTELSTEVIVAKTLEIQEELLNV